MEIFSNMVFAWLALMIIFIIIEIATVGLTTIWFAGGALIATLVSVFGGPVYLQTICFFVVSLSLLYFTRPWAMKYINSNHTKTNYEGVIGKVVRITEKVDNLNETGTAKVNGQEWTARSQQDELTIEAGSLAKVVEIQGVKLIVTEYQDDLSNEQ